MTLVKEDGTPLAKAPGGAVLESVAETDPQVKVLIRVYENTPYDGVNFPTQKRQLAFNAGQVIRQSQWDAKFKAPTITEISPATGPAAGGTAITISGTNFAPDATVTVDGDAATDVVVVDHDTITAKTPAGEAGEVDVVVTTTGGAATATDGFTYTA